MPTNQLFSDWVTGDIITATKLNQMKNDVATLAMTNPFTGNVLVEKANAGVALRDTNTPDDNFLIVSSSGAFSVQRQIGTTFDTNLFSIQYDGTYADMRTDAFRVLDGSAAAPSISFINDTDTGIYRSGTGVFHLVTAGTSRVSIAGAEVSISPDLNVDSGLLFADVSADSVGIGTTTPTFGYKLDVNGDTRINGTLRLSDVSKGIVFDTETTTGIFWNDTDGAVELRWGGTPVLTFGDGGLVRAIAPAGIELSGQSNVTSTSTFNIDSGAIFSLAGSMTVTGTITAYNGAVKLPVIQEESQTITANTATTDVDVTAGSIAYITVTANTEISLTNAPSIAGSSVVLIVEGGGSYTVTWDSTIRWPGGTEPTLSTGRDVLSFFRVGSIWYGALAGSDFA